MSDEYLEVETDIPFGSAYAYRKGDRIKKDAVDANGWQDYVKPVDSEEETPAPEAPAPVQAEAAAPPQPKTTTTTAAGGKDK